MVSQVGSLQPFAVRNSAISPLCRPVPAPHARAEHNDIVFFEIVFMVAEPASLDGSARRVGLWVEPEQHLAPAQTAQRKGNALMGRRDEVRSRTTNPWHHSIISPAMRSVERRSQPRQHLGTGRVIGLNPQRFLEFVNRLEHHTLGCINTREVHVRKMTRFVSRGRLGLLEPLNSVIQLALGDQVGTDIIVWITEARIEFDSFFALLYSVVGSPKKLIRPSAKRVGLCRWIRFD